MTRESYTPTEDLRRLAWQSAQLYERTGEAVHLATERAYRAEVARRHTAGECEVCGYGSDECLCVGTARGGDVVLLAEYEEGEQANA